MAHQLPDELVKLILDPVLYVPDEYFSSFESDENSPFGREFHSTARVLSVCKSWLRVGTPLLYHTVVIRTTMQARALASVLKATPALGRYVRRMRIEGGIGAPFGVIFATMEGIKELHLTLNHFARVAHAKFCQKLPTLNPQRVTVVLEGVGPRNSKAGNALWDCLKECVGVWPQMTTFEFFCPFFSGWKSSVSEITAALCNSSSLKKVVCRDPFSGHSVAPLYASTSLETLVIVQQEWAAHSEGYDCIDAPEDFAAVVRYEDDHDCITSGYWWRNTRPLEVRTASPVLPIRNLKPVPVEITDRLNDNIWSHILKYVTEPPYRDDKIDPLSHRLKSHDLRLQSYWEETADFLFTLSKRFHRLIRPHYFRAPALQSGLSFAQFGALVVDNADVASMVEALSIASLPSAGDNELVKRIGEVLAPLPNLAHLVCRHALTWKEVGHIAKARGDTLDFLCIVVRPARRAAGEKAVQRPPLVFPKLREMIMVVKHRQHGDSTLPEMILPSLKKLHLEGSLSNADQFLRSVGDTLEELQLSHTATHAVLDACPNLKVLHLDVTDVFIENLETTEILQHNNRHKNLNTITLDLGALLDTLDGPPALKLCEYIESLDLTKCEALRTVKLIHFRFATSEAGLKKTWPSNDIARAFVEKHGLTVYDKDGTVWRNRMQTGSDVV